MFVRAAQKISSPPAEQEWSGPRITNTIPTGDAFEELWLENGVDMFVAGHVHWYERMFPMGFNGSIDSASVIDRDTYRTNPGKSITHIINGMAGNIETHGE